MSNKSFICTKKTRRFPYEEMDITKEDNKKGNLSLYFSVEKNISFDFKDNDAQHFVALIKGIFLQCIYNFLFVFCGV